MGSSSRYRVLPVARLASSRDSLIALGLATRQGGRRLAEVEVAETDGHQGVENPDDLGHRGEELLRLADGEVEDLGDVEALVANLEGLPVVAPPVADVAGDEDIGQEVHLDPDLTRALARLAAPALDVEAETARLVAPRPGVGGGGKERPDRVEDLGVGGRVGARGSADGRLVDGDDLVEMLRTRRSGRCRPGRVRACRRARGRPPCGGSR